MEADIKPSNRHCSHGASLSRHCEACAKVYGMQERIAQEHAEMKSAMEKVAAMRSNSGSFLAAQEIIVDALNKINAKG